MAYACDSHVKGFLALHSRKVRKCHAIELGNDVVPPRLFYIVQSLEYVKAFDLGERISPLS